jgi:hypothetical protein
MALGTKEVTARSVRFAPLPTQEAALQDPKSPHKATTIISYDVEHLNHRLEHDLDPREEEQPIGNVWVYAYKPDGFGFDLAIAKDPLDNLSVDCTLSRKELVLLITWMANL